MAVTDFARLMATLSDPNRPRNGYADAPLLANAVLRYQKEQRAEPYKEQLQNLSQMYAQAKGTQDKQKYNNEANAVRQAYLSSGGSPIDLPENLWGSNPDKGFQNGAQTYTPRYAGDNMTLGQKLALANVTGNYENNQTWPAYVQQQQLANDADQIQASLTNSERDYNASMAGTAETASYHDALLAQETKKYKDAQVTGRWVLNMMSVPTFQDGANELRAHTADIIASGGDASVIANALLSRFGKEGSKEGDAVTQALAEALNKAQKSGE